MTSTTPHKPIVRLSTPADLLTFLPYLIGFHPQDSLVTVALDQNARTILVTARLDLPPVDAPPPVDWLDAVQRLAAVLTAHQSSGVILAGYGSTEQVEPAADVAADILTGVGIAVRDVLRVTDGRFYNLACRNPECCPPEGTVFDPTGSPVAANAVFAGLVALPDVDALAASLAPVTGPARDGMVQATAAACAILTQLLNNAPTNENPTNENPTNENPTNENPTNDALARDVSANHMPVCEDDDPDRIAEHTVKLALQELARTHVATILQRCRDQQPVDDEHAAMATVLLTLPSLRVLAARRTTSEPAQIDMWSDLVRRAEPSFVAAPATLLALSALQAGNGVLARLAVERALDSDPHDTFARMLAHMVADGVTPDTVRALLTH